MEKISLNKLIDFRRRSDKAKLSFINSINKAEVKESDGGGDYWVSCVSAINYIFKTDDTSFIEKKIDYLYTKIDQTEKKGTKDRFQKNIDILHIFEEFDYQHLKPTEELNFHKNSNSKSLITLNGVVIEIKPTHIFSYNNLDFKEIGAVWFIVKKDGFKQGELGMFSEIMYRYLDANYSKEFKISPENCIAIDLFNGYDVNYSQIVKNEIPHLLDNTIDDLKRLL
ncbi:hypothetical protein [Flavobacterium sp. FlaQc-48]|uniref:hypothetical protein n=1 Tax=Flavobacterium sp. FlaQc-48 TaxID=3374181 RepID=UPI003757E543